MNQLCREAIENPRTRADTPVSNFVYIEDGESQWRIAVTVNK